MNYFKDAFGGFDPQGDKDAALTYSLCIVMLDQRIDELLRFVRGDEGPRMLEGDPGWLIERRDDVDACQSWPPAAGYRARVDPEWCSLSYPECYADRATFLRYVRAILTVYARHHPADSDVIRRMDVAMLRPASSAAAR
jgi:hypothetical protein